MKWALFEPMASHFGPSKVTKCLEIGWFGTKNQLKIDQKCAFPKILLDYLGCTNKWNEPILSPFQAILAPLKAERALEVRPIWDPKWLKNGSKPCFSKNDPSLVLVPKEMNTAYFQPLLSRSYALSSVYLICR